jgi:hypothetical protein
MAKNNDVLTGRIAQAMQDWANALEQQAIKQVAEINWPTRWKEGQLDEANFLLTKMLPRMTGQVAASMGGLVSNEVYKYLMGFPKKAVDEALINKVSADYSRSEAPKIADQVIKDQCNDELVQTLSKSYRTLPDMMAAAKESADQVMGRKPSIFSKMLNSGKINQSIDQYFLNEARKSVDLATQAIKLFMPTVNEMALKPEFILILARKLYTVLENQ